MCVSPPKTRTLHGGRLPWGRRHGDGLGDCGDSVRQLGADGERGVGGRFLHAVRRRVSPAAVGLAAPDVDVSASPLQAFVHHLHTDRALAAVVVVVIVVVVVLAMVMKTEVKKMVKSE